MKVVLLKDIPSRGADAVEVIEQIGLEVIGITEELVEGEAAGVLDH